MVMVVGTSSHIWTNPNIILYLVCDDAICHVSRHYGIRKEMNPYEPPDDPEIQYCPRCGIKFSDELGWFETIAWIIVTLIIIVLCVMGMSTLIGILLTIL